MIVYEERIRSACLDYVRLRGLLWELPRAHPARAPLAAAVARTDHLIRALANDTKRAGTGEPAGREPAGGMGLARGPG